MKTFNVTLISKYGIVKLLRDAVDIETCILNALDKEVESLVHIDTITIKAD